MNDDDDDKNKAPRRECHITLFLNFCQNITTTHHEVLRNEQLITKAIDSNLHQLDTMGKHGKTKTTSKGAQRPAPYQKKAKVDVTFDTGVKPSKAENKPKATNGKAKKDKETSKPSKAKQPKEKKEETAKVSSPKPTKSDKGKGKSILPPTVGPSTFIVIAGSYEKLLYGLEGSYPTGSTAPVLEPIFIFPAHLACVKAVAASPGGKWLATGSEDEFVKVWDLRRRKEVGSLSQHTGKFLISRFNIRLEDS